MPASSRSTSRRPRAAAGALGEARFDWEEFLAAKDVEIARLSGIYVRNLANAGAELIHARASLVDAHTVALADRDQPVTAEKILIATEALARPAQGGGGDRANAITSNEAFHLKALPERMLIAGGGYIAVEFASIFNGMGVKTTLGLSRGQHPARFR